MQDFRYIAGVTTLSFNEEKCVGCGECEMVCPHGVIQMNDRHAEIIDKDGCMECGACAANCVVGAITVNPGVGCAEYIIKSWIKGKDNATCGPTDCC